MIIESLFGGCKNSIVFYIIVVRYNVKECGVVCEISDWN